MEKSIREVMTPNPAALTPSNSVITAAQAMRMGGFGAVVVVEDDDVRGILTDRDIVVRAVAEGKDPAATTIREVFTSEPATLTPDDSLDHAVEALRESHVRRLPVVEGGFVVGIVTIGDLAQARDENSALAAISAAEPNN